MKKIALLLFVSIFIMFGAINNVHAEEKVLDINLYEYGIDDEMPQKYLIAFDLCRGEFYDSLTYSDPILDGDIETTNYYYNGKLLYVETYDYSTFTASKTGFLYENFTSDDLYEYVLTDVDKEYLIDNSYDELATYDKFVFHLSNKPGSVIISNIELVEQKGMAIIYSPATIDGLNINMDVKFKDINDKVVYKALVKNNTDQDYYLIRGNINNTDEYIKYVFDYDGDEDIIKAREQKVVTITLLYDKEIPATVLASGNYEATQTLGLVLSTEKEEVVEAAAVENPKTVDGIVKTVVVLSISILLLVLMIKVKIVRKAMMVVLALVMIMPVITKALEKINISFNANVVVTKNPSFVLYDNVYNIIKYYEYEEGMTWQEWYSSEYNVDNLYPSFHYTSKEYYSYNCEQNFSEHCFDCFGITEREDQIMPFTEYKYSVIYND